VTALLPTGLAVGDEVAVVAEGRTVSGTVIGARADGTKAETSKTAATDGGTETATQAPTPVTPTVTGGKGRVTLVVSRSDAEFLLGASGVDRLVVHSRGVRREFELVSLLHRRGRRFRKLTVGEDGTLTGVTLGEANVRDAYGVAVMAIRHDGAWRIAPRGAQAVVAGDVLVVVGTRDALGAFEEAIV
jgi:hypothetical protein